MQWYINLLIDLALMAGKVPKSANLLGVHSWPKLIIMVNMSVNNPLQKSVVLENFWTLAAEVTVAAQGVFDKVIQADCEQRSFIMIRQFLIYMLMVICFKSLKGTNLYLIVRKIKL